MAAGEDEDKRWECAECGKVMVGDNPVQKLADQTMLLIKEYEQGGAEGRDPTLVRAMFLLGQWAGPLC